MTFYGKPINGGKSHKRSDTQTSRSKQLQRRFWMERWLLNYFNSIALIKLYALPRSWWMKTFDDTVDDDGGPGLALFYLIYTVEVKAPHS